MTDKWSCEQCRETIDEKILVSRKRGNIAIGMVGGFLVVVLGLSGIAWTAKTKAENIEKTVAKQESVINDIHKEQKQNGQKIEKMLIILELWEKGKLKTSDPR